jgi:hypothetical protein
MADSREAKPTVESLSFSRALSFSLAGGEGERRAPSSSDFDGPSRYPVSDVVMRCDEVPSQRQGEVGLVSDRLLVGAVHTPARVRPW